VGAGACYQDAHRGRPGDSGQLSASLPAALGAPRTAGAAPRIGMTIGVLCLADGRRARRLARDAFKWFYGELFRSALPVLERLYPGYEQLHELGRFRALMKLGVDLGLADTFGMAVVGDPAEVRARIAGYADSGVTHLLCAFGAGAVEPAVTRESLELFAREVMPAFPATACGQPSTVDAAPAGRGAPHTAGRLADS